MMIVKNPCRTLSCPRSAGPSPGSSRWHLVGHGGRPFFAAIGLNACAGSTEPRAGIRCDSVAPLVLTIGAHTIVDVAQGGGCDPDSTSGRHYERSGTLWGGSGTYLRVVQPPGGGSLAVSLTARNAGEVEPSFAVLRLR
jgi:hypothetical protein